MLPVRVPDQSENMSDTFRYNAQKALVEYEWVNTHVKARDDKWSTAVANHLDELRFRLLRLIGAAEEEDRLAELELEGDESDQ